ncbi:MAG: DUF3365 domain-containing protein [Desulfarculaceae bacterium]|nr:DUF3365 domain-containing protein [Desulfarculaceae bacterium]
MAHSTDYHPGTRIWPYYLVLAAVATLALAASLWWNINQQQEGARAVALTMARATLEKDVLYRRWNALHGGVWAPVGPNTQPNPHLKVAEREVTTASGRVLTMINPAYMTRQVHELAARATGVQGHITSLKPIRPGNAPDPWERRALESTELGSREVYEFITTSGEPRLRLLRPLFVEKSCLPCHAAQGYEVGQVRGGLSVSVPLGVLWSHTRDEILSLLLTHAILWMLAMVSLFWGARRLGRRIAERDQARREARVLSGLLPICSHCKKIRAKDGRWEHMETYITRNSEADFSHGLCPECLAKYYPKPGTPYQPPAPK